MVDSSTPVSLDCIMTGRSINGTNKRRIIGYCRVDTPNKRAWWCEFLENPEIPNAQVLKCMSVSWLTAWLGNAALDLMNPVTLPVKIGIHILTGLTESKRSRQRLFPVEAPVERLGLSEVLSYKHESLITDLAENSDLTKQFNTNHDRRYDIPTE